MFFIFVSSSGASSFNLTFFGKWKSIISSFRLDAIMKAELFIYQVLELILQLRDFHVRTLRPALSDKPFLRCRRTSVQVGATRKFLYILFVCCI